MAHVCEGPAEITDPPAIETSSGSAYTGAAGYANTEHNHHVRHAVFKSLTRSNSIPIVTPFSRPTLVGAPSIVIPGSP
jgi:hypothetical protein